MNSILFNYECGMNGIIYKNVGMNEIIYKNVVVKMCLLRFCRLGIVVWKIGVYG